MGVCFLKFDSVKQLLQAVVHFTWDFDLFVIPKVPITF
jgi:hypothetical protein